MNEDRLTEIIRAISDLRDEAVIYGMRLEENEDYAVCCCGDAVDVALKNLARILGISEFCRVENGYIYKEIKKNKTGNASCKIKQYGVHPKGWSPELEEKIKRRSKDEKVVL